MDVRTTIPVRRQDDVAKATAVLLRALELRHASLEIRVKDGKMVYLSLTEKIDLPEPR